MDDDLKRKFVELFAELHAIRLITNEALSITLSHEQNPDNAVVLARREIDQIIETAEKMAKTEENAEFRRWHFDKIRVSVKTQLDAVEKRVSHLRRGRAFH
jgi:cell division septum initiation protein DivIVA